jgi:sec-independent protein translocase protein TatA
MLGNIGPLEIGIVLVIALLVFGPKRLPELGKSVGSGMREFKDSVTGESEKPVGIMVGEAVATEPEVEIRG